MKHRPAWPALLALAVLHYTLVPNAYADTSGRANAGAAARSFSSSEGRDYAAREAAGHAGDFVGGQDSSANQDTADALVAGLVLAGVIILILLIVYLISPDSMRGDHRNVPRGPATWTCPSCGGSYPGAGNCPKCGITLAEVKPGGAVPAPAK